MNPDRESFLHLLCHKADIEAYLLKNSKKDIEKSSGLGGKLLCVLI